MVRNNNRTESPVRSSRVKITPYSQIINICIFIPIALLDLNPYVLAFQVLVLLICMPLFRMRLDGFRTRYFLYLVPLILFIVVTNSFRGGGEIVFRAGPFMLMKQGVLRGLYYTAIILELYVMSNFLTRSFSERILVSTFYTMGVALKRGTSKEAMKTDGFAVQFALMLYYILKLFHSTYAEMKIIFNRRSYSRNNYSLRRKIILFIHTVFTKSVQEYGRAEKMNLIGVVPRTPDILFVLLQTVLLAAALVLNGFIPLDTLGFG
jgi:energy-coupling factor transporter transmembrane protein EcfT